MAMLKLICVHSGDERMFTAGKVYEVVSDDGEGSYEIIGDDDLEWFIDKEALVFAGQQELGQFEIYNESSESVSDEYEEEEWQRLEKKSEDCKCDVAFAYQLSRIQKYLRDYDSTIELVVTKDYLAIITEDCKEFRGNVEQVIDYIRLNGEIEKLIEGMDRRN